jgi:hypothetical protein
MAIYNTRKRSIFRKRRREIMTTLQGIASVILELHNYKIDNLAVRTHTIVIMM